MTSHSELDVDSLIHLLVSHPREISVYLRLASAFTSAREYEKAIRTLLRAIEMEPECQEAWVRLGALHVGLAQWREAIDVFEQARLIAPLNASAWIAYGSALIGAQEIDRATEVRDALLQDFADRAGTHLLSAHLHRIRGNVAAAVAAYRQTVAIEPNQTDALFNLVELLTPSLTDPLTIQLEALWSSLRSDRDRANIGFALARTLERGNQTEQAFALYQGANAAAAATAGAFGHAYDPDAAVRNVGRTIGAFSRETLAEPLEPLDLGTRMIFIVGMPRSGTTLVERILSSHPQVCSGGELPSMQHCLSILHREREAANRSGAIRSSDAWDRELLVRLRTQYLDSVFERDLDAEYVIDKLPANFAAAGLIRTLFPDAIIIHCIRDPLATCWSLYTTHLGPHLAYHTSLEHLSHYYDKVYGPLMDHWRNIFGSGIVNLHYEELVQDCDSSVRGLLRRCELPWADICLRFAENPAPAFTASMQSVREPINARSVSRWRLFEQYLRPLSALHKEFKDVRERPRT